ncbi:hypothetical protein [Cupriavidus basilensis]|nr:hypothetical protein [Cupriavidus basilensis]MDF3883500.1 hypothetical protein [Cupriavidus basilensis]
MPDILELAAVTSNRLCTVGLPIAILLLTTACRVAGVAETDSVGEVTA